MLNLSDKERQSLEANPFVLSVGPSQVQFTAKFKIQALKLHSQGIRPSDIFTQLGIDLNIFLKEYPKKCLTRWKKIVAEQGEEGLKTERRGKGATGRPKKEKLSGERALHARIAILEGQVDFLKKLRALEEKPERKKRSR